MKPRFPISEWVDEQTEIEKRYRKTVGQQDQVKRDIIKRRKERQVLVKDVLDQYHQYCKGHETFTGFEKLQYEFYATVERLDQHGQQYGYEE